MTTSRPDALAALAADPAASGLILDFDGVLSPIVADPGTSAMPDGAAASLARLAGPLGLLAVLSGRPAAFLADRVRVPGVLLLGSYGLERIQDGERHLHPAAERWLEPVREASRELEDLLGGVPGIRVERKSVSVAVHWRQAPDAGAAAAAGAPGHRRDRRRHRAAAGTGEAGRGTAPPGQRGQGLRRLRPAGGVRAEDRRLRRATTSGTSRRCGRSATPAGTPWWSTTGPRPTRGSSSWPTSPSRAPVSSRPGWRELAEGVSARQGAARRA